MPVVKDVDRKGIDRAQPASSARSRRRRATASSRRPTCRAAPSPSRASAASAAPTSRRSSTRPRSRSWAWCARRWRRSGTAAAFAPRLMLPLCVSYDHRVIDGALAARFTRHLCHVLEDVRRLVLVTARPSRASARSDAMTIEIKVPDIGDFKDVPVIEVHVQAGGQRSRPRTRWSRWSPTRRPWTSRRRRPGRWRSSRSRPATGCPRAR